MLYLAFVSMLYFYNPSVISHLYHFLEFFHYNFNLLETDLNVEVGYFLWYIWQSIERKLILISIYIIVLKMLRELIFLSFINCYRNNYLISSAYTAFSSEIVNI